MSEKSPLIASRVIKLIKDHPEVTASVSNRMEELITGRFSEGRQTSKDLSKIAKELILGMATTTSEAEEAK